MVTNGHESINGNVHTTGPDQLYHIDLLGLVLIRYHSRTFASNIRVYASSAAAALSTNQCSSPLRGLII